MARNAQLIELDLRSGLLTNEPLYTVGQRLVQTKNSVWGYPYPELLSVTAHGPWGLRQPLTFPDAAATTYGGAKTFRDLGFSFNSALHTSNNVGVVLLGPNGSDQYSAWSPDGTAIAWEGGVGRFTIPATKILGCSVKWANPGVKPIDGSATSDGIFVFSHPDGTHVYYILDSVATVRSLTTDVTGCPAGARALTIHLDRLWIMDRSSPCKISYTDPLNIRSIRTTNVIQVNGYGRCLLPGQFGAVDASGVPHLVIGTTNAIYVLDGDPQLGGGLQADLRTLNSGIGMLNSHAAVTTQFGVFYLGTDGQLWQVPPGLQQTLRVSGPIRDKLGIHPGTPTVLDQDVYATGTLLWLDPFLYIYPGGDTSTFYMAEPSTDGLRFWGPMTGTTPNITTREAIVRMPPYDFGFHNPVSGTEVPSVHSIDITANATTARYLAFDTLSNIGTTTNRTAQITSGLLNVPGHQIQATRVWLETLRVPKVTGNTITVEWTVQVLDERGNAVTGVLLDPIPAPGTYAPGQVATLHFAIPPLTAARGAQIVITATAEASLALLRAFVEVHTTPAQY
jgi:hypothetical protein